jgi:hypothetical protein
MTDGSELDTIRTSFADQVTGVYELLDFDRFVIDHVVGGLESLAEKLEIDGRNSAAMLVRNRVSGLLNVRKSDSLRPRYQTIFNQCVVLLVSYFGSSVGDVFRSSTARALDRGCDVPAASQEIKLAWQDFGGTEGTVEEMFAELLVAQRDISFQDMQSVHRAFKEHLRIEIGRTEETNDIILGQAARHVIVHSGGVVDARMVRQVSAARPRRLKPAVAASERIEFTPGEVRLLGASMTSYIEALVAAAGPLFD